ncbi:hypothetical protein DPMN_026915 [Dreissena polymorpha]|uniref:Uncharacterized protein n=1 Tax=Dreissena polymorpha TaxID=45954 RepID=A0A9D4RD62_DREPO|nr:hypothetical protein DPMN_026915 [Dreissena polymorpha]
MGAMLCCGFIHCHNFIGTNVLTKFQEGKTMNGSYSHNKTAQQAGSHSTKNVTSGVCTRKYYPSPGSHTRANIQPMLTRNKSCADGRTDRLTDEQTDGQVWWSFIR